MRPANHLGVYVLVRATVTTRARGEATAARLAASRDGGEGAVTEEQAGSKWDASSRVGDHGEAKAAAAANRLRAAEEFLLENPELKAVHSNASIRTLLAKSEQQVTGAAGGPPGTAPSAVAVA